MNKKINTILRLLYQNKDYYVTAQELAYEAGISDRTARKYVNIINDNLIGNGATIQAKRGHGFQLLISDTEAFNSYFQNMDNPLKNEEEHRPIQDAEDRQYYLLKKILLEGNNVFIEDLAQELFVSRSTISNELVEVRKKLEPYQLSIESKPHLGLYVTGREQSKRHFIMEYFFMNKLKDNMNAFSLYTGLLEEVNIAEILMIVIEECREAELQSTDFVLYNIVLHIGLAIKRIRSGFKMDELDIYVDKESIQHKTANRIIQRISESLDVRFPVEEADYIALHLYNKVTTTLIYQESAYDESEIKEQLIHALSLLDEKTSMNMAQDQILLDGLMTHFSLMFVRLRAKREQINPLLSEIIEKHGQVFEWVIEYIAKMPVFQKYEVSSSEWAYVAIHLLAAIERFMNKQKVHILVICATGVGSSQMLKQRLENEFGSKIVIKDVISYFEITDEKLKGIDLIVSSISLSNAIFNIPIIQVSVFLDEKDIELVNAKISLHKGLEKLENTPQLKKYQAKDTFYKYFRRELFLYIDQPITKETLINKMIKLVEDIEKQAVTEDLKAQLKLRESFSSVAFSKYLAVPHPVDGVTHSSHVVVAIVPSKVEWDQDNKDIQLVFMMLPDKYQSAGLEVVSRSLTAVVEEDSLRKELVSCKTFDEFSEIFIKVLSNEKYY